MSRKYTKSHYIKQMRHICICIQNNKAYSENEIIVDNFAGGGGASTGIETTTGKSVDIAINHDPEAIRMHKANHPNTKHYCENVWDVNPLEVCKGKPVGLAWFSPDCKHFSKAKGGKPKDKNIRSEQVKKCGNMVCPPIPAALVKANLSELCTVSRMPNMRISSEQTGQLSFA